MTRSTEIKVRLSDIERGYMRFAMERDGYREMNEFIRDLILAYARDAITEQVDRSKDIAAA